MHVRFFLELCALRTVGLDYLCGWLGAAGRVPAAGSRTARNNQAAIRVDRRPGRRGADVAGGWRQRSERGAAQRPPTGSYADRSNNYLFRSV